MKNRIRQLREARGQSQQWLAEKANTSQSQIDRLEKGERKLTQEWMKRLAPYLGVQPADLMLEDEQSELGPADISGIVVRGFVQAGYWRESAELPPEDWYIAPMPNKDARYPGAELFGLQVRGTSMNKVFPEGVIISCISLNGRSAKIPDGKYVVVQRTTLGGEVEMTVKQLQRDQSGRTWLWPRSDDPEHQTPIQADFGDEIRIVALVVGSYITV